MWLSGCGSRVYSESTKTKIKPFKWKAFNKTYQKLKKKTYKKKRNKTGRGRRGRRSNEKRG